MSRTRSLRLLLRGSICWASAFGAAGCGHAVALVPESPPDAERLSKPSRVPYPPPPADVEVLPLRRRDECYWRDGFFSWNGAGWKWTDGVWIVPPENCTYAPPETRWEKEGGTTRLVFYPPEWQPEEAGGKCEEPRSCSSLLPESEEKNPGTVQAKP